LNKCNNQGAIMNRKKIFLILGGVVLLLIVGSAILLFTYGKPEYAGFRSFRVVSIEDSTLKAEITVGIRNKVFFDITLERLQADLVDLEKKIGNIAIDQKVYLPSDAVSDLKVNLTLNMSQALQLLKRSGNTIRVNVKGEAVAGVSFLTLPVGFEILVPMNIQDSLFSKTGSAINDSVVKVKRISDIALDGDSIRFDLSVEINNPYNIQLEISDIDSGVVLLGEKPAGRIYLEEAILVEKNGKAVPGVIKSACYIGDILNSGPSTLFGLFTSAGKISYRVKGKLKLNIFNQDASIPLNYKGKLDLKEILKR